MPRKPTLLRTGQVLEQSGVTRQMLYQYQAQGLIEPAETTPEGHNLYDPSVVGKLKVIREALDTGYTLRDVKETFFDPTRKRARP